MNLFVLDRNFSPVAVVDTYESLIWADRYYECGDFELYTVMSDDILQKIKMGYYLVNDNSDHAMVVEKIRIDYDVETGNHITIAGRSLESILDRRVVWGQQVLSGNLQQVVKSLLDASFINPSKTSRKVPNFIFKETDDPVILGIEINAQYTGDNIYEVIKSLCTDCGVGFKLCLNDDYQLEFELYSGVNRSYDQSENSFVIFSPTFDNMINSNYIESEEPFKNVALIGGEGEGSARKYAAVGDFTGLDRKELFVDARDISSTSEDQTISNDEYQKMLQQRGKEKLSETTPITSFEGEGETTQLFVYGRDFSKGDIVQVANEYGHETKARVLEVIMSEDENGFSVYPTFGTLIE